ncbi:hypothetical protein TSOC_003037 [Tetrabaena socialis]|uniref:CSC1/OSCA1-like cytosolic domain-containing protein n=1 Tax=Tetrabaena socialis TaxID=47790 RepID=A0A2J8ACK2_9CHLO|nr:hypothetical protein TSOC_003037 [Tetrabaena socialis]|eukprot:PNH10237.1 hypothetical protein TSOC_003037 [Tetrabaena socialis]
MSETKDEATRNNALSSTRAKAPYRASARTLGVDWGVGVGLHFELLRWLRWLVLVLLLCAIPYMVVVGCSVFTDAAHAKDHTYGIKKYPASKALHAMSFAAIVDDSIDNGTLQYMNTELARTWRGPMEKGVFLTWISLVDAGAMLVFVLGLAYLWIHLVRFTDAMDRDTLEAADYTVLVRGLPGDVDAVEVGKHFSRYGEVMDVVLVTDRLSATLARCGQAARLQQRRAMVLDAAAVRKKDENLVALQRLDDQLEAIAKDIRVGSERRQHVRAAFVTFNSENERRACEAQCPNGWLSCVLQPLHERFQVRSRFWVKRASAPEDYKLEHLAVPEWQLAAREIAVNFVTLLLVLLCATVITKLTDMSNQESTSINWTSAKLTLDTTAAMIRGSTGAGGNSTSPSPSYGNATALHDELELFCTSQLKGSCTAELHKSYGGMVRLVYGSGLQWANATSRLIYERPVRAALQECATATSAAALLEGGGVTCALQSCLPCLCLGMEASPPAEGPGATAAAAAAQQMSWGIRLSISLVVAALNAAIKLALKGLVVLGRHWTHTARERSYALQCFFAMLCNTVAVLLLVNCNRLGELARQSDSGSWIRYFVRYGSYGDFSALWYENVGLSIMILMIINTVGPLLTVAVEQLLQAFLRFRVLHCMCWPVQADFDRAWARPRFTLEQRTADLLLNAALALLFGSGMPLLYLVFLLYLFVAELADRWALTRLCGNAPRYNKGLSRLVMGLLPWLAVAHCAFGLWMHTYFKVVSPEGSDVGQINAAVRSTNARLSATSGDLSALQRSSVWQRITQANGLALLLLFAVLMLWLLIGRYVLWRLLSFLGRASGRLFCPHAPRFMRMQLSHDAAVELQAVPYAEALLGGQLHGAPTYRLAHHPHYTMFFAASGLNRAVGMAALVVAAASGGAGRSIFTRLKSVRRRGHSLGGASAHFVVLPEPVTSAAAASDDGTAAKRDGGAAAALGLDRESCTDTVIDVADSDAIELVLQDDLLRAEAKGPGGGGVRLAPPGSMLPMSAGGDGEDGEEGRGGAGGGADPDVCELLQREEQRGQQEQEAARERRWQTRECVLAMEGGDCEAAVGGGWTVELAVAEQLAAAATAACIIHAGGRVIRAAAAAVAGEEGPPAQQQLDGGEGAATEAEADIEPVVDHMVVAVRRD